MTQQAPVHRFPWRTTAVVVGIVVAASVLAGLLLARTRVDAPPPAVAPTVTPVATTSVEPLPSNADRQLTLLLNVRDDARAVMSSTLLGVGGPAGSLSELTLPPDLLLPTTPPMRLEQTTDPTGVQTAQRPLEALLGVHVDAILDLDRLAWGGLVDLAAVDAGDRPADTAEGIALQLDRVLSGLPRNPADAAEVLTGLGSMARTTVPNQDMSALLAEAAQSATGPVERAALPVVYLRAGDDRTAVMNRAEAQPVLDALFPSAALQTGHSGAVRVVLVPAGASAGAVMAAREALTAEGMAVVVDDRPGPAQASTGVLIPDGSEAARDAGASAAAALGLPASSVQSDPAADVDATVLLGTDARWRTAP